MIEYKKGKALNGISTDDARKETSSIRELLDTDTNEVIGAGIFYYDEETSPIYYLIQGGRLIAHKDRKSYDNHSQWPHFIRLIRNIEYLKKLTERRFELVAEDIINDRVVQNRLEINLSNMARKKDK